MCRRMGDFCESEAAMAFDNFSNTPFDRDRDGEIDPVEEAQIYDTFYKEKDDPGQGAPSGSDILNDDSGFGVEGSGSSILDDEDDSGEGWYPSPEELEKHRKEMDNLRKSVETGKRNGILIVIGIAIALGILIPNKLAACLLILILYGLATVFGVFK